jgi:hypothetical protein
MAAVGRAVGIGEGEGWLVGIGIGFGTATAGRSRFRLAAALTISGEAVSELAAPGFVNDGRSGARRFGFGGRRLPGREGRAADVARGSVLVIGGAAMRAVNKQASVLRCGRSR